MTPYIGLSMVFVAAGAAQLAAVAYLAGLVKRHRRSIGALLNLAKSGHEPLQLPPAAWPTLADGGIIRLDYSGIWFAQSVHEGFGKAPDDGVPFSFTIAAGCDVRIDFRLYAKAHRGEARLFAENLTGVFRLLLETSVQSRMEALSVALTEQARLSLYLQHDLRNLAQWVEWLAADLAEADELHGRPGVVQRLCCSAPHAAARARRILDATCKRRSAPESVALAACIREASEHAGISVAIDEEATVWLRRDLLDRTLDNLFANVAPLLRHDGAQIVEVNITQQADVVQALIRIPRLPELAQPEKLFEPFASGRPGGLGLGLYQAHKSSAEAGGALAAEVSDRHICFRLSLPARRRCKTILLPHAHGNA